MGNETAWVCITAVAIVGILALAFIFKNQLAQPLQYQPQHEEALVKLTEVPSLSMQKKKIIGYVTSEE